VTGNNYFYPAVSKHLNKLLNIKHERGIPSRAVSSVTTFMETMRQEGCKDGCFRTIVPTVTCAKAICLHHSINMEWGVKEHHVAVIALHNCGKSHSQIFELLKLSKISRKFVYWVIKRYKELWKVAYMAWSGHLKSVRADTTIKTVQEQIH